MRYGLRGFLGVVLALLSLTPEVSSALPSPPEQPASGPGGSEYVHDRVQAYGPFYAGGKQRQPATRYFLYEPASPRPDTAPVVLFLHGFGATDPVIYQSWIEHIVRKGYVVAWVQYQAGGPLTLPGAFSRNAARAWIDALGRLETGLHVRPQRNEIGGIKTAIVGHSLGGYLSVLLAARAANPLNGIPAPYAVVSIEPGGKNVVPPEDLGQILPDTKVVLVVGDEDAIVCIDTAIAVWEGIAHVPVENRDFLVALTDRHGSPAQVANHFFPTGNPARSLAQDARDFFITYKLSVAALHCVFEGTDCSYAFGKGSPEQVDMGAWSDGEPVLPLTWVADPSQLEATCQGK